MSAEYEEFKKIMYDAMIKDWSNANIKLYFPIYEWNVKLIMQRDPTVTVERIMEDFRKYPLVKEVFLSWHIYVVPK